MTFETINDHNFSYLASLFHDMWPETDFAEEVNHCKEMISSISETSFLAKEGNQYVGFAYVSLRHDWVEGSTSTPTLYLEGIYVREEYRGRKTASKLLELCKAWGRSKGCTQIGSDAEIVNATSQAWHKAMGFQEVNRVVCFIQEL